jgi:DNA repair ATPase RecN
VDGDERTSELAAMLGGVSDASLAAAAEMLANAAAAPAGRVR